MSREAINIEVFVGVVREDQCDFQTCTDLFILQFPVSTFIRR